VPQARLGINQIKKIINLPNPPSKSKQKTVRKPDEAGAAQYFLHHQANKWRRGS
jgi:hypothetical protein